MNVERGTRDKLEKYFDISRPLKVSLQVQGSATYDFCCFGVDKDDQLSDDRYMIFYNQMNSPRSEIVGANIDSGMTFTIKLNDLPQTIQKLVFTASIDGNGTMHEISSHKISIGDEINATFGGKDFEQEKAITSLEIYRKNGWRFNVVARGFNGGLDALLAFYGGEQADDETPAPQPEPAPTKSTRQPIKISSPSQSASSTSTKSTRSPFKIPPPSQSTSSSPPTDSAPKKISLEKKIQDGAPKLVSLVKPLKVELEKRNLLDVTANVALVMDISGSMSNSYRNGTVQEIVNKILPIAVQFDDDGELDFWYFADRCQRRPTVNMKNYEQAVPHDWDRLMSSLGYGTNELVVMREVVAEFETSTLPAYVVFITDGGFYNRNAIKNFLIEASYLPIFWQFVGVSGSGYGLLEELDNMSGRYVDNANFFALDDFKTVPNQELYSRLLNEFPAWLKLAKTCGVLDGSAKRSQSIKSAEQSFTDKIKGLLRL